MSSRLMWRSLSANSAGGAVGRPWLLVAAVVVATLASLLAPAAGAMELGAARAHSTRSTSAVGHAYDVRTCACDGSGLLAQQQLVPSLHDRHGQTASAWRARVGEIAGFVAAEDAQIGSYSDMRKLTAGQGGDIQAHHLIEKRFQNVMGGDPDTWDAIVLSWEEHQAYTNAWRREIGYGKGTRGATRADVIAAANRIYTNPALRKKLGLD